MIRTLIRNDIEFSQETSLEDDVFKSFDTIVNNEYGVDEDFAKISLEYANRVISVKKHSDFHAFYKKIFDNSVVEFKFTLTCKDSVCGVAVSINGETKKDLTIVEQKYEGMEQDDFNEKVARQIFNIVNSNEDLQRPSGWVNPVGIFSELSVEEDFLIEFTDTDFLYDGNFEDSDYIASFTIDNIMNLKLYFSSKVYSCYFEVSTEIPCITSAAVKFDDSSYMASYHNLLGEIRKMLKKIDEHNERIRQIRCY